MPITVITTKNRSRLYSSRSLRTIAQRIAARDTWVLIAVVPCPLFLQSPARQGNEDGFQSRLFGVDSQQALRAHHVFQAVAGVAGVEQHHLLAYLIILAGAHPHRPLAMGELEVFRCVQRRDLAVIDECHTV